MLGSFLSESVSAGGTSYIMSMSPAFSAATRVAALGTGVKITSVRL